MSTDEMTGVQALERKHPGLPLAPGKVERREFEYIRHGTRAFILSRDVVTGRVVAPTLGPTRTEADFLATSRCGRDRPERHALARRHRQSEHAPVRLAGAWVAQVSGRRRTWASKASPASSAPGHPGRLPERPDAPIVFHYTPKHASWMNQIEIWLSILTRKLLRRASFTSIEDLTARVLAFIDYYNQTMARPFKWTYQAAPRMTAKGITPGSTSRQQQQHLQRLQAYIAEAASRLRESRLLIAATRALARTTADQVALSRRCLSRATRGSECDRPREAQGVATTHDHALELGEQRCPTIRGPTRAARPAGTIRTPQGGIIGASRRRRPCGRGHRRPPDTGKSDRR